MHRGILAVVLAATCLHCHSSKGGTHAVAGAQVTPRIILHGTSAMQRERAAAAGSAVSGGLSSLQYYIRNITLCKDATLDGTGISNSSGCVSVYEGPDDSLLFPTGGAGAADYAQMATHARSINAASATSHGPGYGYIDLLDPNSRATLQTSNTFTTSDIGDYNYGLIYWAYPVKLTATLTTAGGNDFLYTHDGNVTASTHPGGITTTFATDLTAEPASESVVNLGNGGTWIKFQQPFSITQDDINDGTEFFVDLAFDPNGIISGYNNSVYGWPQLTDAANDSNIVGNYITVPFLDLAPVPHRSTETLRVETYTGTIGAGTTDHLDVRVELYSIAQDNNHTIYGVHTTPLVNAETTTAFAGFGKAAFIKTNADGSINLLDWNRTTFLSNLARQTTVGGQTTVGIGCTLSGSTAPVFTGCTADLSVVLTCVDISGIDD